MPHVTTLIRLIIGTTVALIGVAHGILALPSYGDTLASCVIGACLGAFIAPDAMDIDDMLAAIQHDMRDAD